MAARHRGDTVEPRLAARNPSVPIVVLQAQSIGRAGRWHAPWSFGSGGRPVGLAASDDHFGGSTGRKYALRAFASRTSTVRAYLRRTSTTRTANQQRFINGIHCVASWCFFRLRFTSGPASVRFSRSEATLRRVAASAAQSTLSCASDKATMCSMSVSRRSAKQRPFPSNSLLTNCHRCPLMSLSSKYTIPTNSVTREVF